VAYGRIQHAHEERGDDAYFTPREAVVSLIRLEADHLPKVILEPACGDGAIVLPLREAGFRVVASDLNEWGCPDSYSGVDFLRTHGLTAVPGVVTNPPYKLARCFVVRALQVAPYVAMLLRLPFLEGTGRFEWFQRQPPARVWVSSRRLPMMHRQGWEGPRSTSKVAHAWFVWDAAWIGETVVRWFDWKEGANVSQGAEVGREDVAPSPEADA
jgi:hypothetical protein